MSSSKLDDEYDGSTKEDEEDTKRMPRLSPMKHDEVEEEESTRPPVIPETPRSRSGHLLRHKMTISDCPSEVYCVKYSPDGTLLAAGCGDGAVRVYDARSGELRYNLNVENVNQLPTTSIRFRPTSGRSKTKNVLLAVNADGSLDHWHITSGRKLHTVTEKDNQLLCVDYRYDGAKFATAGKDYKVRIYDEATKTRVSVLSAGIGSGGHGHSNRVFSLKFKPESEDIVVSGGWDNTVQIWDLRVGSSVQSFYGPHICGDTVDVSDNTILTGSYKPKDALQTWDLRTGKLVQTIPWSQGSSSSTCQLYAAQFSTKPSGRFVAAGGSNENEARVFDTSKGNALVGVVRGFDRAVYATDFSPSGESVVFAGGDKKIYSFALTPRQGDVCKMSDENYRRGVVVDAGLLSRRQ